MKAALIAALALALAIGTYATTKVLATDHTHTAEEMAQPPLDRFTPGHSGGLDQNGGHWDRKSGTYHYHR